MQSTLVSTATGPSTSSSPTFSSIGRKIWMAVSGVILLGFVIGHLIGNLQVFLGQDQLNTYAKALRDLGGLLWLVRAFMFIVVAVHIFMGVTLYFRNKASRPVSYVMNSTVQASLASRTMFWTGLGILLYVVYHLLHFTIIVTNPEYAGLHDAQGRHDVYSMVVLGFQNYLISAVYIVAMFLLAVHLSHAVASFFQTLGLNNDRVLLRLKKIANVVAVVLFVGYVSIPVAILAGWVTLPGGGH